MNRAKTALVTGGNRGIGLAICQGLLAAEFELILAARSLSKGQAAAKALEPRGNVRVVELDVADDGSLEKAANALSEEIDHLDVLINNAGIYPDGDANILTISRELLAQTLNTNTFGAVRVTQSLLPLLEKAPQGRIINVSSGYGTLDSLSAGVPSYCLSKLALNGATLMLDQALRSRGIAVYGMCPGWVRTEMGGNSAPRSPQQGADTAIWLATATPAPASGKFYRDRAVISY
ncbi:MAG: SDR family NAD(P)-dependent oxidoreductase [Cyanobacteriota bacterium]|nr:SDR family NAD(P)-dependent oxidoreductase [Cyanobacteriota bacterium]